MKKTFHSAYALAKWILANINDPLHQEQLMIKGINNNYTISV